MSTLGLALATARRAKGLSQEELALRSGLTQEAISRYERGSRRPSPDAVAVLAQALDVTPKFLESVERIKGAWAVDAHMRRRATAPPTTWRRLEARLNMLRNHARYLYEEVGVRAEYLVPRFDPLFTNPDDAARMTRMQWHMPSGPVHLLVPWLEAAGCLIVEEDFDTPRVDGLSQWVDEHPIIFLNIRAPVDRKRLTIAHELGHLCLHTEDVGEDIEKEASAFAAEFLMPAEVIRPQLRSLSLGRLIELKRYWGVSMQALMERAYQLGVLPSERRTSLYKQLSYRNWRKQEPSSDDIAPEVPRLVDQIAVALIDKGLTPSEIASLTGFTETAADNPFSARRRLRAV